MKNEVSIQQLPDGSIKFYPCESPCCPKHCKPKRQAIAKRMEVEFNHAPYTLSCSFPIGQILEQQDLSPFWRSYSEALRNALPKCRYCFVPEIQDNAMHFHGLIHWHKQFDDWIPKSLWKKYLWKKLGITDNGLRLHTKVYSCARDTGEYLTKTGNHEKEIQLQPKGLWHQSFYPSLHYGKSV